MQANAFTSYLRRETPVIYAAGRPCDPGELPSREEILAGTGCTPAPGSPTTGDPVADATARRAQDFRLAGDITTALAHLTETLATGIITADTQRQAQALTAQTQQAMHNLSQYGNDPTAQSLLNRLQGGYSQLPPQYQQQYPLYTPPRPFPTTAVAIGVLALGAVAAGAYVLTHRAPRKNPVVGHGRDRHFVKASKLRKRAR